MRTLSANALTKIATRAGTEPVAIVEVDWVDGPILYADRDIDTRVKGRILAIGNLDNVVSVSDNNATQEISITLDDTDGSIKAIFDANDIHKRPVRVYQWFDGLDLDDRFLLFAGKLSSPIAWNERDRTVAFNVVSQLEDKEIGFSAEEGQFPYIPNDLVGKSWPMIFGKVADVPALRFNEAVSGTSMCGVGIISGSEYHNSVPLRDDSNHYRNMYLLWRQSEFLNTAATAYEQAANATGNAQYAAQAAQLREQHSANFQQQQEANNQKLAEDYCALTQRSSTVSNQGLGCNPVRILGGEDFPQNTPIAINIGGGIFVGYFTGDQFTIQDRYHEPHEITAEEAYTSSTANQNCTSEDVQTEPYEFVMKVPKGFGDPMNDDQVRLWGWVSTAPKTASSTSDQVAQYFWAEAGSRVVMHSDEPISYIASIIPGTVLAVKAYKTLDGVRRLVNVPTDLWTVETKNYGPITAVQVVLDRPLSTINDQGWSDDIYVTFESSIGPHTVDILAYLISTYTDLTADTVSFAAVRPKLNAFPMNFPILDRKNAVEVLQEIAFQARCGLWISNGTVYLKYLPEEPAADETVTLSDLDADAGIEVGLTETEDLVTKMIVRWHLDWADDGEKTLILRHNVAKYGTQAEKFDFYCFNQPAIVLKAATFWLIRKANTWKRIKFKTFLNKLNLETFDCVDLQLGAKGYVASGNVKAIVKSANYNSDERSIDMECWVPVRAGEMAKYPFAWPATLSTDYTYPPQSDIDAGNAGGAGIGQEATGALPIGFTDLEDWGDGTVWVGGPNVVFGPRSDWGDRTPSDVGFVAQEVVLDSTYAELDVTPKPNVNLKLNFLSPIEKIDLIPPPGQPLVIDLRNTTVVDSESAEMVDSRLDTVFRGINADGDLVIDTHAKFGDDSHEEEFDFRFDEDGGKFAAGTAFLKA